MRIHVTANGKATSISVDETLMDYYGAHLVTESPKLHTNAEKQFKRAKKSIQNFVRTSENLPEKDLSQYIQKILIENIVGPHLDQILKVRGPRFDVAAERLNDVAWKAKMVSDLLEKDNKKGFKPTP